jgi:hypothetical protein
LGGADFCAKITEKTTLYFEKLNAICGGLAEA